MTEPAQKVAVVTGSGRARLGNLLIHGLAADGYAVVVHFHRSEEQAQRTVAQLVESGRQAIACQADVASEADVKRMFDTVEAELGSVDVLATTASIWRNIPLEDVTSADVQKSFGVNALGTFLCARDAGLRMCRREAGGVIITFGDWAVARPYRDHAAYFVAKGSIPTMTRMLAIELGERNPAVRVNCIHPGPVMFPEDISSAEQEQLTAATLTRNANHPESILLAVRHLINNPFVTGVCLPVDGGRTIWAGEQYSQ